MSTDREDDATLMVAPGRHEFELPHEDREIAELIGEVDRRLERRGQLRISGRLNTLAIHRPFASAVDGVQAEVAEQPQPGVAEPRKAISTSTGGAGGRGPGTVLFVSHV